MGCLYGSVMMEGKYLLLGGDKVAPSVPVCTAPLSCRVRNNISEVDRTRAALFCSSAVLTEGQPATQHHFSPLYVW